MTKLDLQKELLEKVKPGMKPSDIKKSNKAGQKPGLKPSPSPIQNQDEAYQSDPESILSKSEDGYSSAEEKNATTSPNQQIKNLQAEISSLKKRLTTYQDFKDADMKIKEKQKQEIQAWEQKYSELEKQAKNTVKVKETKKQSTQTPPEPKEPKQYLFTCDICQQNQKSQLHLAKVNGLGIDPNRQNKICDACVRKVDVIKEREEEFF